MAGGTWTVVGTAGRCLHICSLYPHPPLCFHTSCDGGTNPAFPLSLSLGRKIVFTHSLWKMMKESGGSHVFPKTKAAQFLVQQLLTPYPKGSDLSCTLRHAALTNATYLLSRPSKKSTRHDPEPTTALIPSSDCASLVYKPSKGS